MKLSSSLALAAAVATAVCEPTNALATDVSGTIVNQTWTSNNSPYRVVGNILVAGLTIKPGVTVLFTNNYAFEVAGKLSARGTPTAPIVFMGTNGGWQGIYFNNSSPGSVLACCTISNSVNSGIRIVNSNPTIKRCSIVSNSSGSSIYGGGIYASVASGNLTVADTLIANNKANINPAANPYNASYGGGVYAAMNTNSLQMSGCTVTNNQANANYGYGWAYGGGIFVSGNASLNWCVISGNSCKAKTQYNVTGGAAWGGGVFASGGQIALNNCLLKNNTSSSPDTGTGDEYAYGGGLYISSGSVRMTNCIVQGNIVSAPSGIAGGGICVSGGLYDHTGACAGGGASLNAVNCTIAYNNIEGLAIAGGSAATILNSIAYFNASGGAQIAGVNCNGMGTADVTYSDVQGGFAGVGNINFNPIFFSTDDLIIVPGSSCANAGSTNAIYKDLLFPPSLPGSRNDMGAHGGPGAGARMQIDTWPQIEVSVFGGVPGYSYLIQSSTNLTDWQTVEPFPIAHLGDVARYLEPSSSTLPLRFYKLNLAP